MKEGLKILKIDYIQQLDETDCGPAALAMVLKYYKSNISIAKIRDISQTDQNGTTALGLVKAAQHFNLNAEGIEADMSIFSHAKELPIPFIIHSRTIDGDPHYVVVTEIDSNFITIADPDPKTKIKSLTYSGFKKIWSGIAIFLIPSTKYAPITDHLDSFSPLIKLVAQQKKIIFTILLASVITTGISIASSFFLQKIVDSYIPKSQNNLLTIITISLFNAYLLYGLLQYIEGYLSIILSQRISIDLLLGYIKHLFEVPLSFFYTRKTGEITSRFSDANNIIYTLASTAITVLLNLIMIIIVAVFLVKINFQLFLVACISVPLYAVYIQLFKHKFDVYNNDRMESGAKLSSSIIEDLTGIETIKSLNAEKNRYQIIKSNFDTLLKKNLKYEKTVLIQESIKKSTELCIEIIILYLGSLFAMREIVSVGQLIAFYSLMGFFLQPLESIVNIQSSLQIVKIANMRLNQIFIVPNEKKDDHKKENFPSVSENSSIELKDLCFEYKYGQPILKNISCDIQLDSSVAIVGFSGSGKTTLAKLLVGFFVPTSGEIKISNINLSTITTESIRNNITYVPQKPYLFSGTVAENIALGNLQQTSQDKIIWAANVAEISKDIEKWPDKYNTKISIDGTLSGGQQQRIAIARALLSSSKIIIFDEATSNLDVMTEQKVINNILQIPGKTFIFIAHRLKVAQQVKEVFVMQDGKIIEHGSHNALLKKHGQYYNFLYN